MSDNTRKNRISRTLGKIFLYCTGLLFLAFILLVLSLKIYLTSPYSADQIARLLSKSLKQTVKIYAVHTSGSTLYLKGFTIVNPPGFPAGDLARIETVTIAPQWEQLLLGQHAVRLVRLEGATFDLLKNSNGAWNFSGLLKPSKKPPGAEIFINQLIIKDGTVRLNGRELAEGASLTLFDLATKGSRTARIELAFQDPAQNSYFLSGKARPGSQPDFELSLKATALSLPKLAKSLTKKEIPLREGNAALLIKADLHKGLLRSQGNIDFDHLAVGKINPLAGRANFSGDYNLDQDLARLQEMTIDLGDLIHMQAVASVRNLKRHRDFSAEIKLQEIDLKRLVMFLPENQRQKLLIGGRFDKSRVVLAGNAAEGLTALSGTAQLQDGSLAKDKRVFISGLNSNMKLARQADRLMLSGDLGLSKTADKAMLENLQGLFKLELSPRLKLLNASLSPFQARILGQTVKGFLGFNPSVPEPLTADLQIPAAKMADLNSLLEKHDLRLSSGNGSLALKAHGLNSENFSASVDLQVFALTGKRAQNELALKKGGTLAQVQKRNGKLSMSGTCQLQNLNWAGKSGQARFSYRYADKSLIVEKSNLEWDRTQLFFDRLMASLPSSEKRGSAAYFPLSFEISGANIHQGQAGAQGITARMSGFYSSDGNARWLEGSADLSAGKVFWKDKPVAAPAVGLIFSRTGATGTLSGTLLGGPLSGKVEFNPFAASEGGDFRVGIKGASLANAGELLSAKGKTTVTSGLLDANLEGSYSPKNGINGRFEADGAGIRISSNAKEMLSDGSLQLAGAITGQAITLQPSVIKVGQTISLELNGQLEDSFSKQPHGSLSFLLPATTTNSIVDSFVNLMPRFLQEATVEGTLASQGTVTWQKDEKALQGNLAFKRIGLDSPEQKIQVRNLDGNLPFSLDLTGNKLTKPPERLSYSKKNYALLLQQLEQKAGKGQPITIERISLGPLDVDNISLLIRTDKGITEIASIRAKLFEGTLLGSGLLSMQQSLNYRTDLLLNDLSLKALCDKIPNIRGYITGKVDGVVSVSAQGKGLEALTGFSDLWARKGKGEQMLVSREFLQRLAGKKLSGFFFRQDRPYDKAEISATLEQGYLAFSALDIENTNLFGLNDLNVSIAPTQNRIAIDHLLSAIKQAAASGKAATDKIAPSEAAPEGEFKWQD